MSLSEGFGFEERWLRMLTKEVPRNADLFDAGSLEHAQYVLGGLGNCQVRALRDWARAMSFIEVYPGGVRLSHLAQLVCQYDPLLEENGTWWVIHSRLAANPDDIWFYSFYSREFAPGRFTRADLRLRLQAYRGDSDSYIDKKCLFPLLHTMSATRLGSGLGLLRELQGVELERLVPDASRIPVGVVAYILLDWMSRNNRHTVGIEEIIGPEGPGRLLSLPKSMLNECLDQIQDRYAKTVLWVSRTSGLDSVARDGGLTPLAMLRAYYLEHLDDLSPMEALKLGVEQERDRR